MRSPMVRLTVGICLPEGVLLIVMAADLGSRF